MSLKLEKSGIKNALATRFPRKCLKHKSKPKYRKTYRSALKLIYNASINSSIESTGY